MGVNLFKGGSVSLTKKDNNNGLTKIFVGLGWDVAKSGGMFGMFKGEESVDLDASCVLFDANKNQKDVVWFRQLKSKDGSIVHSGDNRTGAGDGDDEVINVDLTRIPEDVQSLVFVINSFLGQTFDKIDNAVCRLVNPANNEELVKYTLSQKGNHTAQIMVQIYRDNGGWSVKAIGEAGSGRTYEQLLPLIKNSI